MGQDVIDSQVAVYDGLAPLYDQWTDHPAYAGWVERLLGLAIALRPDIATALDVGCGTGKSTAVLAQRLPSIAACDPSAGMLEVARRRLGTRAALHRAGLPGLEVPGEFDYVSCLNDVINYVPGGAPLQQALTRLARHLRPGGILLFDSSTVAMYRELFAEQTVRTRGDHVFRWAGDAGRSFAEGSVARARLQVEDSTGRVVLRQRHCQHHHPEAAIRRAARAAGLRVVGVWGHRDDGMPQRPIRPERHTKLVWLMERP